MANPVNTYPALRVTRDGLRVMALATFTPSTTLMFGDDGTGIRHARLMVESGTATFVYVRFTGTGATAVSAAITSAMVSQYASEVFDLRGFYSINVLSPTGTAFLNITPVEY